MLADSNATIIKLVILNIEIPLPEVRYQDRKFYKSFSPNFTASHVLTIVMNNHDFEFMDIGLNMED